MTRGGARLAGWVFAALGALLGAQANAATFTIINGDSPGEGFNDDTPATPVGGNDGTTVGEQRLIAFQYAADLWGARINSDVDIEVEASFDALSCNAFGAVLGQAGPLTVRRDFTGAPEANTWYAASLANAIRGSDLDGSAEYKRHLIGVFVRRLFNQVAKGN